MIIKDGSTGRTAEVDSDNKLNVFATSESEIHEVSLKDGLAFAWMTVTADLAAADTALLLCNDDPNRNLFIDRMYVWADVPTTVKLHFPAYNASFTGTAVTGVNFNRCSSKIALATAYADETANSLAAARTFLTLHTNELTGDQYGIWVNFSNAIILGYHDSIAIDIVADSAAFECSLWGYYHE